MGKITRTARNNQKARNKIQQNKKEARIGFLESLGDSGYDNRTDPNYCYEIMHKLKKSKEKPDTDQG